MTEDLCVKQLNLPQSWCFLVDCYFEVNAALTSLQNMKHKRLNICVLRQPEHDPNIEGNHMQTLLWCS
jgi:hypothetical protein